MIRFDEIFNSFFWREDPNFENACVILRGYIQMLTVAHCLPSGNLIRFDEIFNSVFFVSDRFFEVSITYENI